MINLIKKNTFIRNYIIRISILKEITESMLNNYREIYGMEQYVFFWIAYKEK